VALRNATLNIVGADSEHRVVLRLVADRYHQLTAQRTRSVCHLHAVLCLLIEGGTGRSLSTPRAVKILAGVAIGDPIIAERIVVACRQFVTELEALDQALVDIRARTVTAVDTSKTTASCSSSTAFPRMAACSVAGARPWPRSGSPGSWSVDRSSQRHPGDRRDMMGTTTSGGDGY
jgi:hypothetical protein